MVPHVLLLGGHGKVSLLLTPRLLARSWNVTSVIRDSSQTADVLRTGRNQPGKLEVIVRSLEEFKTEQAARSFLDEVKPDYVIWSAGAGGKGGSAATYSIDRDAARAFIRSATAISTITKFLMISYLAARSVRAPWWTDDDWASARHTNTNVLPDYYNAKLAADQCLTAHSRRRRNDGDDKFQGIVLRPGYLTDDAATGMVKLGKTKFKDGMISRADVAEVAISLLDSNEMRGWIDAVHGSAKLDQEIGRILRDREDSLDGEDMDWIDRNAM